MQFYVDDIEPMQWNVDAFNHLVYDEEQKDIILSFVEGHTSRHELVGPEVIMGKGQGLVILLSGPPGTGKTLTAEAVADRIRRPLFYLHAEDLGVNPASLGANIKRVFDMATDWNAIVLLDEADVFMATRTPSDIHRNELISIFLRELEYFRGVIFLTTNLFANIDGAFRSRVSLHLVFKALNRAARENIWKKFIDRMTNLPTPSLAHTNSTGDENSGASTPLDPSLSRVDDVSAEDIRELSRWQLNGREIENAAKMARCWCDFKGYGLNLHSLEKGIRITSPHASKEHTVDENDELYN